MAQARDSRLWDPGAPGPILNCYDTPTSVRRNAVSPILEDHGRGSDAGGGSSSFSTSRPPQELLESSSAAPATACVGFATD
eukprot:1434755-Alexandrium_andersonii.AAC.1